MSNSIARQAIVRSLVAAMALAATSTVASATTPAGTAAAPAAATQHCYGVARAGHNDCAAGAHSCAGPSTRDNDPASFVALPIGVCMKLTGGSLTAGR